MVAEIIRQKLSRISIRIIERLMELLESVSRMKTNLFSIHGSLLTRMMIATT
jgi:hypothetical protein